MTARIGARLVTLISLSMAATFVFAQEDPPPPAPDQDQAQDSEAPEPKPKRSWLSIAYNGYDPSGNRVRLNKYSIPAEGFYIRDLHLFTAGDGPMPFGRLSFRGVPGKDSMADGLAIFNKGRTRLSFQRDEAEFYAESLTPPGKSRDRSAKVALTHSFAPEVGGYFAYQERKDLHNFEPPKSQQEYRTQLVAGGIEGKLLGGQLGVSVSDQRFYDYNNYQPTTLQSRVNAHYGVDVTPQLSLEGSAGVTRIEQAGRPKSHIRTYALSGWWDIAPRTALQFNFGKQDLDLNVVQNAYVQKYLTSSGRLIHRWNNWSFQLGMKHNEAERVRKDHTYVDVPKWNIYDARISGRVLGDLKLTARGQWQQLRGSAVMLTLDNRQLFWDDKALGEIKLAGGNEKFSGYAGYSIRFWRNAYRGSEVRWHNFTGGASYMFNPELSGYFECSYDSVKAQGAEETGVSIADSFPDSYSAAAGVNWNLTPLDYVGGSLNYYVTNNHRGVQFNGTYRRDLGSGNSVELMVTPFRYDDRLYGIGTHRNTFITVNYTTRF